jgi:hypothetical protein
MTVKHHVKPVGLRCKCVLENFVEVPPSTVERVKEEKITAEEEP